MSCLSQDHKSLNAAGVGLCSCVMWWTDRGKTPDIKKGSGDAGFCDEPAYGFIKESDAIHRCSGLACPSHGGPEAPALVDKVHSWSNKAVHYMSGTQYINLSGPLMMELVNIILEEIRND